MCATKILCSLPCLFQAGMIIGEKLALGGRLKLVVRKAMELKTCRSQVKISSYVIENNR